MTRKQEADPPIRLQQATGMAAAMLSEQMAACGEAMRTCLEVWEAKRDVEGSDEGEYYFDLALRLADASAKLGGALARMNGESRQHISVERLAHGPEAGGPGGGLSPRETLKRNAKTDRSSQKRGGEA